MSSTPIATRPGLSDESLGLLYGLLAVAIFSLTLPFTRMAVAELDPTFVALGRALVAAILSALWLRAVRAPLPPRAAWRPLAMITAGCVLGFPWLTSIAMRSLPASHGAIVIGVLPLATALFSALRGNEKPSPAFWGFALAGSALVIGFALIQGGGQLLPADAMMLAAVLLAALGYAEGGKLSSDMAGERVICWALVLSLPIVLPLAAWSAWHHAEALPQVSLRAWTGFAYVSAFSMFIGFFFWYRGMALGGIARVGQVQLLQPFFTLIGAAALLGEHLQPAHASFALGVLLVVGLGRRTQVKRRSVK